MKIAALDAVLSRCLPRECGLCGCRSETSNTCSGCLADLPWLVRCCRRCSAPLPAASSAAECVNCDIRIAPLSRLFAALVYEYPVDRIVTRAKFARRPDCANLLGEWLARALANEGSLNVDVIVPVPLARRRLAVRGFNQSVEISRAVGERMNVAVDQRCCRRVGAARPQSELTGSQRRLNVRGAFRANAHCAGRRVAIIDDVVTTGSTLVELAKAISRAGAADVQAWVVARTVSGGAK